MKILTQIIAIAVFLPAAGQAQTARDVDCLLEPASMVTVSAGAKGVIQRLTVDRGTQVVQGELLVQLDDDLERLQAEMAAAKAQSDVDLRAQEARRGLRQQEYDRAQELLNRNVAASTVLEDAQIELALTELALEEARFAQQMAVAEARLAAAMLERRRVLSPVNGVVVSVEAAPGEYVNEQMPILTLAETDPLHIEVFAPAALFGQVRPGDVLPVSLNAPLSGRFDATVTITDPLLDAASGTFGIRLEIGNPDGAIPAGARCTVGFGS